MEQTLFKNLMIEPTNNCNLTCPVCSTGSGEDKRKKGFMKLEQFKKIIDPNKNFLDFLQLSGYGEPFLSPYLRDMIKFAGENNIYSGIFTNGLVLNKKVVDIFKKNYRLKITFSIDGIKPSSYSYYRKDGNFKKALNNLCYLVDFKKKNNLSNLEIIWQFLIMKTNENEIKDAKKMADKLEVDQFKLKTISIYKKHPKYSQFVPRNKEYQRKKSIVKNCVFITPGMPFILWNGDVAPCCVGYKRDYVMGNVFEKSLSDIWRSEKYKKFRKRHKKGANNICNKGCRYNR